LRATEARVAFASLLSTPRVAALAEDEHDRAEAAEVAAMMEEHLGTPASFRPEIDLDGAPTRVLVEQTGAVDATRPGDYPGHLTAEEQWGVDLALETLLDLQ
jgi:hypothetical protein